MDERILQARAAVRAAEAERDAVIAEVQAACPHPEVIETHGYDGLIVYFKPTRRCVACDLQEGGQGSPWVSWYEGAGSILANQLGRSVTYQKHCLAADAA